MSKLKRSKVNAKLNKDVFQGLSCSHTSEHITFSYKLLTDDKHYTFEYFDNNFREYVNARKGLDGLLKYLSLRTWLDLKGLGKCQQGGYELLPSVICSEPILKNSNLTPEVKVLVFRFCGNKYRLLGYRYPNSCVLYVLGFDFDYTAYDHGS